MKVLTLISDTHARHGNLNLPGGDILIFAGNLMSSGYKSNEIISFLDWFKKQKYTNHIFIAGNRDVKFEDDPTTINEIVLSYKNITYLKDTHVDIDDIKIYGSPWQPISHNTAFGLPRGSDELSQKWNNIPNDTDILITHGPPICDITDVNSINSTSLGCELLRERVNTIKPKIHVFGNVHSTRYYDNNGNTHFINASINSLNHHMLNTGLTFNWNPKTNEILFI